MVKAEFHTHAHIHTHLDDGDARALTAWTIDLQYRLSLLLGAGDDVLPQYRFTHTHFSMQEPLLEPKSGVLTRLELVPGLQEAMALLIGLPLHAISIYPLEVSLQFLVYQLFSLTMITISSPTKRSTPSTSYPPPKRDCRVTKSSVSTQTVDSHIDGCASDACHAEWNSGGFCEHDLMKCAECDHVWDGNAQCTHPYAGDCDSA